MKQKSILILALLISIFTFSNAKAGIFEKWGDELSRDIGLIKCDHNYDVYIPAYAWHNRLTYDSEHIDKYNENPWGFGFGISRYDYNGNWSGLYAMGFKDSNSYLETFFGYARQWNWNFGENEAWRVGAGYTLGITQRHEYAYIPIPAPLPLIGIGYKKIN